MDNTKIFGALNTLHLNWEAIAFFENGVPECLNMSKSNGACADTLADSAENVPVKFTVMSISLISLVSWIRIFEERIAFCYQSLEQR